MFLEQIIGKKALLICLCSPLLEDNDAKHIAVIGTRNHLNNFVVVN